MAQNEKMPVQRLTTKVVSEALGYTQQSVRNAIEALGISPEKVKGGYVLTVQQASKIAEHFGRDADFSSYDVEEGSEEPQETTSEIELLKSVVQTLQGQLEEKDKQIERLQKQLDSLLETNKALSTSSAAKQVAETKELLIADSTKEPRKGFWARLFEGR